MMMECGSCSPSTEKNNDRIDKLAKMVKNFLSIYNLLKISL